MRDRRAAALAALFLATVVPVVAQVTTGSISGYVLDSKGAAIPGAHATVSDPSRGFERHVTAGPSGFYLVQDLAPSSYDVSASAAGFDGATVHAVPVEVNARVRLDVTLAVAGQKQSVEVRAAPPGIQTESSEMGGVIDQSRIQELPLNRRDFLQLAMLAPGVLPAVQDSQLSQRGGFAFHVSGGREEFNNFLIDGVDNNDPYERNWALQPPVDSIQEFKIETSNYSAEYGRAAGGQINLITRSGSNQWHGSAYEYLRNRVLDARNFFDGALKPEYVRNQFGAGAGGPIVHDRTFFFVNFDDLRERLGLTNLASVPTADERSGNLAVLGAPVLDPFTRQPFPGAVVPASRMSPVALKILELYPLPNLPGLAGNYLAQPVQPDSISQYTGRLDHNFSSSQHLTVRYSFGSQDLFEPYTGTSAPLPGFGDFVTDTGHNVMLQQQTTLGPRTLNSVRLGFNRYVHQVLQQNHTTDVGALWGVPWLSVPAQDLGYPSIAVTGLSTVGDSTGLPIARHENVWQLADGLVLVRGNHGIKIGGEARYTQLDAILDYYTRGSFSFLGGVSGTGMGDLLLGFPSVALQAQSNNPQTLRTWGYAAYVQDDWKIARRLTLNLGLRYEYDTPPVDPTNRMSVVDLSTAQIVQVGTNGISRSGLRPDRDNFAPRAGFAWQPAEKLVVRGGYGIYYDPGLLEANTLLSYNPPYFNLQLAFPTAQSLVTLSNPFSQAVLAAPSPNTLSPDLTTGYVQQWNLNVQRELPDSTIVSVAYVGAKGTRLLRSLDLNQPPPAPGPLASRRPYPQFGGIFFTESGGNSNFNALEASVNRRLTRNLSLLASYTFSKSIDDTSAFLGTLPDKNFPQNSHDYHAERALSSFDMRQHFTAAYLYNLPGRAWWARNFAVRGIATVQSGQPFTPTLLADNSNTGNTGGILGSDRPNVVGPPRLANPSPQEWFNTAAFAIAPAYHFGDAGRNIVEGPGRFTFDVALSRRFTLREGVSLQVDVQAFNLFNRANFDLPQLNVDDPSTFGRIFSAEAPRQIQFALRLAF